MSASATVPQPDDLCEYNPQNDGDLRRHIVECGNLRTAIERAEEVCIFSLLVDNNAMSHWYSTGQNGHLKVVRYLVEAPADKADDETMSPLYISSCDGALQVVKYFMETGADVDKSLVGAPARMALWRWSNGCSPLVQTRAHYGRMGHHPCPLPAKMAIWRW